MGLKEATEYALELKKAERAKEVREQRASSSRPGSRISSSKASINSRPGSAVSLLTALNSTSTCYINSTVVSIDLICSEKVRFCTMEYIGLI